MEPLVSVLIPAYNAQEWIASTIESALNQSWRKTEIIVVDDGSADATVRIANQFASRSVKIVSQRNQGAAAARNTAYALCQGDYIQWLDADDLLHPSKIEQQVRMLESCSSDRTLLSGAWAYFICRTRKARFVPTLLWADLSPVDWLTRKMANDLHMQTDNWLVSRRLSDLAGPWDTRLFRDNDGEYFCRVILASDGVKFVPDSKSYYRQASFERVSYIGRSNKKMESLFLSMQLHMQYLRSLEDSDRTRSACRAYIASWLPEFYVDRPDIAEKLREMTATLGGELGKPRLSWKYSWIQKMFGWGSARRAQLQLPKLRNQLAIAWDRGMFQLEKRTGHAEVVPCA